MKIITAFIKLWWHCLVKFHRMEYSGIYICCGHIPIKYTKIKCSDCNKIFYENKNDLRR